MRLSKEREADIREEAYLVDGNIHKAWHNESLRICLDEIDALRKANETAKNYKLLTGTEIGGFYEGYACARCDFETEIESLRAVLQKIADPRLMDHQEPDLYTQLGCIRNIANEALNA